MRILIVGAGALGGLVGAYLTRAGEDVTLLDSNPARSRLLNDIGLEVTQVGVDGTICVPLTVVTSVHGLPPFDLVFIAVKSYQTQDAVRAALPATHPGSLFLSMQNGIGNTDTIAAIVGADRVLCGTTYHSVQHGGPGRVRFRAGIRPIQIAPFNGVLTPAIHAIGERFRNAGLDTEVVTNIDHVAWQKLLHNAVINPVSAITGLTCRELLGDEDLLAFMRDLCTEIVAVMRARGIPIVDEGDPFRPLLESLKALGNNRPSMWQDLMRGVRTEVDALNGAVVAEAGRLGLSVPHNTALVRFIHSRERHKFLSRQAITQELGLESPAVAAEAGPQSPARTTGRRRGPATMPPVPALESSRRLGELVHRYYRDLDAASRSPDRMVATCSALAPVEIARALGITPYFPENHAALISARHQGAHYITRTSSEGFSQFSSSAMRCDIGALLTGSSPLTAAHDIAGPPKPDLVIGSTNTGQELLRWFDFHGAYYRVPVMGVHPPPALHELDDIDLDAVVDQLLRLVEQLQVATGRLLHPDQISQVVEYSEQAAQLWREILELARAVPAPITFFDTLTHVAPMVLLRGTAEAVDYYRLLKSEVEDRVAQGIAAVPGETLRFYWDGPPIWHAIRSLASLFSARGIAVVASTFGDTFTLPGFDPREPVASLARTYATVFSNRSEDFKNAYLAERFTQFGIDAAAYHDCRTAPEATHVRYGMAVRAERQTRVPRFVIESDSHDERLLSLDRLQGQLAEFIEQRPARAAGSLGVEHGAPVDA